jgi:curved DNA-binding protein
MASGGSQALRMDDGMGGTRTIEVAIPRGIEDGAQVRVKNAAGARDLLLTIKVTPHLRFKRGASESDTGGKGLDLWVDLPLNIAQATLGGPVPVPTLDGPVELTLPAGTDSGKRLRLKGKGLTDASGARGDLYAQTRIVVPRQTLSQEERDMLLRIASGTPADRVT